MELDALACGLNEEDRVSGSCGCPAVLSVPDGEPGGVKMSKAWAVGWSWLAGVPIDVSDSCEGNEGGSEAQGSCKGSDEGKG